MTLWSTLTLQAHLAVQRTSHNDDQRDHSKAFVLQLLRLLNLCKSSVRRPVTFVESAKDA